GSEGGAPTRSTPRGRQQPPLRIGDPIGSLVIPSAPEGPGAQQDRASEPPSGRALGASRGAPTTERGFLLHLGRRVSRVGPHTPLSSRRNGEGDPVRLRRGDSASAGGRRRCGGSVTAGRRSGGFPPSAAPLPLTPRVTRGSALALSGG